MRRWLALGGLMAIVVGALAVAGPAVANELRVSNDPTVCPNAQFTTIQAAINASGPGATVKVCPGTYREQVRITGHTHDGLRLESLQPQRATIKWPTPESPPLALVDASGATGVVVRGFVISGPFTFPGCSPERHEGVLIEGGASLELRDNHITLIQNSVPGLFGCQEGDAVAVGHRLASGTDGTPGTAAVENNVIDEYQKNGVQIVNTGSRADVEHNTIRGSSAVQFIIASNGVVVFRHASATIEHNEVSNNKFTPTPLSTGISAGDAVTGAVVIDHNTVFDNDFGIQADSTSGDDISHNSVSTSVSDGIQLCGDVTQGCSPANGFTVNDNKVFGNKGSGIDLIGSSNNVIGANHVDNNGTSGGDTTDGIRVDKNSTQNRIESNHLHNNVTFDCHDDSVGTGTAGTANFWTNDHGDTQNRPGLCRPGG